MLKVERRPDEDLVRELHGHLKNSQGEGSEMRKGRRDCSVTYSKVNLVLKLVLGV